MKKVLVLGAGLVTRPHVQYLLDVPDFHVTVASRTVSKAEKNIGGRRNGTAGPVAVGVRACVGGDTFNSLCCGSRTTRRKAECVAKYV